MNLKNYLIMILLVLVVLSGIILGFYINNPFIWVGGLIIAVLAYVYTHSSKIVIKRFLSICKKYNDDERANKLEFLLSKNFKESYKHKVLSDFNPQDVKNINLQRKSEISNIFLVTFNDGSEYIFQIVKRAKITDGKDIYNWVIDDIEGNVFENKDKDIEIPEEMLINR